jgi:hypothetical protein
VITVTLKLHLLKLPLASVAVKTTAVVPVGKLAPVANVPDTEGVEQLSVTVGVAHCAIAFGDVVVTVIFVGQEVNTGFTVSLEQAVIVRLIVTLNEHVLLLFFESEAV